MLAYCVPRVLRSHFKISGAYIYTYIANLKSHEHTDSLRSPITGTHISVKQKTLRQPQHNMSSLPGFCEHWDHATYLIPPSHLLDTFTWLQKGICLCFMEMAEWSAAQAALSQHGNTGIFNWLSNKSNENSCRHT